jgi:hypothetical protein
MGKNAGGAVEWSGGEWWRGAAVLGFKILNERELVGRERGKKRQRRRERRGGHFNIYGIDLV